MKITWNLYWKILAALSFATVFAVIDLYLVNLSSYVAGGLLAWVILEGRNKKC